MKSLKLHQIYAKLREHFGYLDWWPGDTTDEVVIGAILTQQTSWKNVERAISNLRQNNSLNLVAIARSSIPELEAMTRPAGFYRQKSRRLKSFALYVSGNYKTLDRLFKKGSDELRTELLSLNGIGPETADSIILYAAGKPVFVVDAYTKRIMHRIYGTDPEIGYDELQRYITSELPNDVSLYNDFHAQLVELGKNYCRAKPLCNKCPLKSYCLYYSKSAR